jgi:hypothetical protein
MMTKRKRKKTRKNPDPLQFHWLWVATQARINMENALRSEKKAYDLVQEIRKGCSAHVKTGLPGLTEAQQRRFLRQVELIFKPAFKVLWKAKLSYPPDMKVCGKCADWQFCRHTEGWRVNQPCTGEARAAGVCWKPGKSVYPLAGLKGKVK